MSAKKSLHSNIGVPAKDQSVKGDLEITSAGSSQVLTEKVECNKTYNLRRKNRIQDMGSASLLDSSEPGLKPYYCCP